MDLLLIGIKQACWLLLSGDPEVWRITFLSLQISLSATLISLLLGIPFGVLLALKEFPGRQFVVSLVNTGMSLPPVVVGLFVTMLLWRSGPMGFLHLLYTPTGYGVGAGCDRGANRGGTHPGCDSTAQS